MGLVSGSDNFRREIEPEYISLSSLDVKFNK